MNGPVNSSATTCHRPSADVRQQIRRMVGTNGKGSNLADWLPLAVLPAASLLLLARSEPWVLMWSMAFTLYAGCKWLTWRRARNTASPAWRSCAYLFLWPGMDAPAFLDNRKPVMKPSPTTWLVAWMETGLGAFLLWGIAGRIPGSQPLLRGWTGMLGVVLLLHFGLFQLSALSWQRLGVNARPLMRVPIAAKSLADFWGRRWNSAFHRLAHDLVFRPLHRRVGTGPATFAVFAVSGLVHDLLISVPARGGYGLPTAYFLLQGAGLWFERSRAGRAIGLGRGARGRLFALAVTAGPLVFLFRPIFIRNVILPMLHAIGAT